MNHNAEQTTARPDDTAFNIQRGRPTTRAADSSTRSTSSSPMDDESTPSECDYAERVAAQNNMEVEVSLTSPLRTYQRTTSRCPLPNPHVSPTRRRLTLRLMVIPIRQRNLPLPLSSPTAPMFRLIPACGTATLRQPPSLEPTNSSTAMYATWHVRCNAWHAFLSKEASLVATATTLRSLNYSENLPGTSYQPFSKLGGTNCTHLTPPLSGIR